MERIGADEYPPQFRVRLDGSEVICYLKRRHYDSITQPVQSLGLDFSERDTLRYWAECKLLGKKNAGLPRENNIGDLTEKVRAKLLAAQAVDAAQKTGGDK